MKKPRVYAIALLAFSPSVLVGQPLPAVKPAKTPEKQIALPTPSAVTPLVNQEKPADVIITIEPSRNQPTVGSSFSLSAVIKNNLSKSITLTGRRTTLFLPPEITPGESPIAWYAFFPTETNAAEYDYSSQLPIAPGDSYTIAWTMSKQAAARPAERPNQEGSPTPTPTPPARSAFFNTPAFLRGVGDTISAQLEYMFFSPGDYKASVDIRYVIDGESPPIIHTATQAATVHVAAPEFVILFGAAIGGLLSYIISIVFRSENSDATKTGPTFLKILTGATGSILLGAIVTILLSRLSETQFLIKVTINDFWGAVAIGFVANLSGIKVLENILSKNKKAEETAAKKKSEADKSGEVGHSRNAPEVR